MTMRRRTRSRSHIRTAKKPVPVNQATAAAPNRQLKSGYGTYEAAEKAALVIKKQYPQLQVTVYDAKAQRHTTIEQPKAGVDPRKKPSQQVRGATSQPRVIA